MQRRTFLKASAAAVAGGVAAAINPKLTYAEDDQVSENKDLVENSWRYDDGTPIPQSEGPQSRSSTTAWSNNGSGWINGLGQICPGVVCRGIDVSVHQGDIDWAKVKNDDVSFAIIRCGYWNVEDKKWQRNASECQRLGIPFGAYLYSYASTPAEAKMEAESVLKIIKGYNLSYPVFYDMEDDDLVGGDYAGMAKAFCDVITAAGYKAGVYANLNWWNNNLTSSVFDNWTRWVARYHTGKTDSGYSKTHRFWQCSSTGSVKGISGYVDLNFEYNTKLSQEDIASGKFYDTPPDAWYVSEGWLSYAVTARLMQGDRNPNTGELTGYFYPNRNVTRGQLATILFRYKNPSSDATSNPDNYGTVSNFKDVATKQYYTAAIEWCRKEGIITGDQVDGKPTGYFRPNDGIKRAELAVMAQRFAAFCGVDTTIRDYGPINSMADVDSILPYAREAMAWCAEQGIMTGGLSGNKAYALPESPATRAQTTKIMTVLTRDVVNG